MDQLSERAKFLKALMQMAVVALQKSSD
jgi:hypothetical protein